VPRARYLRVPLGTCHSVILRRVSPLHVSARAEEQAEEQRTMRRRAVRAANHETPYVPMGHELMG